MDKSDFRFLSNVTWIRKEGKLSSLKITVLVRNGCEKAQTLLDILCTRQHSCCYYVAVVTKVLADKRYEVKFMRRSKT